MSYAYWRTLEWFANHLPLRIGPTVFGWLGQLVFLVARGRRSDAIDNMGHVLGPDASEAQVRAAARAAFAHLLTNYYFIFRPVVSDEVWRQNHTLAGREHLDAALATGKGVILFSAHFGFLEHVGEVTYRDFGLRILVPHETIKPEKLYQWFTAHRERVGGKAVPANEAGALDLARHLRRGSVVALTADYDSTRGGIPIEFCGAPALLPQGPARLALLSSAIVIPVFGVWLPDGRLHTTFEAPLTLQRTRDREADLMAVMQQIAGIMERWFRAYPTQWTEFNPIWRWAEEWQPANDRGQTADSGQPTAADRQQTTNGGGQGRKSEIYFDYVHRLPSIVHRPS